MKRNKLELERRKLEIDLDIEQNELKEQMDLAKVQKEILYEDQGSSSSRSAVRAPEQDRRNHPSNVDINKMLDECYTFLGSGKIDGAKACRVYCPSMTSVKEETDSQNQEHRARESNPREPEKP